MGTKLEPDEPRFVLAARDPTAPQVIRHWAYLWQKRVEAGVAPSDAEAKVKEAADIADAMESWRKRRGA